jgi:hypothetical protein
MNLNVTVHIEELVLHGFAPGDRHAIAAGLQGELGRLLTEHGLPPALAAGASRETLAGAPLAIAPESQPTVIGAQVARSVYEGAANV